MKNLCQRMKSAREKTGLKRRQIAELLGVTDTDLGEIEAGKAIPTAEQIEILEGLYCCELTRNEEKRLESMPPFQISGEDLSADELMALAKIGRIALNSRFMANILS